MSPQSNERRPPRRPEPLRPLALGLVVLFVPVLTLYAQLVGHHTTLVGSLYLALLLGVFAVQRVGLRTPRVDPAWKAAPFASEPPAVP